MANTTHVRYKNNFSFLFAEITDIYFFHVKHLKIKCGNMQCFLMLQQAVHTVNNVNGIANDM
jgi:hypothetical protein